ncbi:MAG: hypothetical protein E7299_01055 [Lachnospiraceae bacterium]|nr:hypothetical protein [Lachnospiraceae bacterium]
MIFHLYPGACEKELKKYYIVKIRMTLLVLMAGILLTGLLLISSKVQSPIIDNQVVRNDYLKGTQEIEAQVNYNGDVKEIALSVKERQYTTTQLDKLWEEMKPQLEKTVLGENASFNHITKDLELVKTIEGYPFSIAWECSDYHLIDSEGMLRKDNLKNGQYTEIKAILTYYEYRQEFCIPIYLYLEELSEEELFQREIKELLQISEEDTKYDVSFCLPNTLNGMHLEWSVKKDKTWVIVFVVTFMIAIALYFLKDQDLEKRLTEREGQMILDYPEMVNKLSLYMGAGMSIRHSWEKIVTDYEKKKSTQTRYVYEEMWITLQEMKSGISEAAAYDRFGKRCNVQIYLKFSNLLIQNLRKGSTGLSVLLREESRIAFAERKNYVRKKGEEAGTKLLLPMMLMLCLVMVMIMLPAFLTF